MTWKHLHTEFLGKEFFKWLFHCKSTQKQRRFCRLLIWGGLCAELAVWLVWSGTMLSTHRAVASDPWPPHVSWIVMGPAGWQHCPVQFSRDGLRPVDGWKRWCWLKDIFLLGHQAPNEPRFTFYYENHEAWACPRPTGGLSYLELRGGCSQVTIVADTGDNGFCPDK